MEILWTIIIGFIAGIIARFLSPGPNNPQGFILTTLLGIVGAFVATFIGQKIGLYAINESAGLIGPSWAQSSCSSSGTGWSCTG
jgi:uncharacterized membrane protein YeaQ/YmgE (transglycosylase-associated protein family)